MRNSSGKGSKAVSVALSAVVAMGALGTLAASNSGAVDQSWPTAESPIFNGLPRDVVTEVLANPRAQENVRILPADATVQRDALWQGMVINFVQCRQLLAIYQTWQETDNAPELPPLVLPTLPGSSVVKDATIIDGFYRSEVASGDIAKLRADLTNESGCGPWIPANPGDVAGPTIADVVTSGN